MQSDPTATTNTHSHQQIELLQHLDDQIRNPLSELKDLSDNLLYLSRVEHALCLRASLIEDEDLRGQLEALLVDKISPAVDALTAITASLQSSRVAPRRRPALRRPA